MSPKQRFQVMLELQQIEALKAIQQETGATVGEQIRRAVDEWLERRGVKTKADRKRAATRKRP